jgi:hypothetical protein
MPLTKIIVPALYLSDDGSGIGYNGGAMTRASHLLALVVLSLLAGAVRAQEARTAAPAQEARPPRLYVAFSGLKDKTGRLSAEQVRSAEEVMRSALRRLGAMLAPEKERPEAAKKVLRKHDISGYRLMAEAHPTAEGGLRLAVVCLSYPDMGLLGDAELRATGAEPAQLLAVLAPRIIEEAADAFEWE